MTRDSLASKLTLDAKGKSFVVAAGNLKRFAFDWSAQGFRADAEWWLVNPVGKSDDGFFETFANDDLLEVELHVERSEDLDDDTATPIVLKGLVTDKWVEEHVFDDIADGPVLQRRYGIRFADRLAVLWRQHKPCSLYANSTLKKLFEAHLPQGATLKCSWPALETQNPMLSLALGADFDEVSFYDFVHWLVDREHGYFHYDADKDSYELAARRVTIGKVGELDCEDVAQPRTVFKQPSRATAAVLNGSTLAAKQKPIANASSATGVQHQYLLTTGVASQFEDRVKLETARAKARKPELELRLARYPKRALWPATTWKQEKNASTHPFHAKAIHWVRRLTMTATATQTDALANQNDTQNEYESELLVTLEREDDDAPRSEPYRCPRWPMLVEGKIVSEIGETDQGTYQIKPDQKTSLDFYRVKVPLFDDLEIPATFDAGTLPGHFYFPAVRDQRVLLALDHKSARITHFIDFRPEVRLPADSQGNQVLMGKSPADGTTIKHWYREGKPVLTIDRQDKDSQQTMTLSTETMLLSV